MFGPRAGRRSRHAGLLKQTGDSGLRYRTVLFDLDGTLVDTAELIIASFQHTFRYFLGRETPREQILATLGEPLTHAMRRHTDSDALVSEMVAYYRKHNVAEHDRLARPFPGARLCLEGLRAAGCAIGLVTSKARQTALMGLRLDDWEPFLDVVICAEDCPEHKPSPLPVLTALEQLQVQPGPDVLMVGDTLFDILAGQRAGVDTAGVLWSAQPEALRQAGPALLPPDFAALLAACVAPVRI